MKRTNSITSACVALLGSGLLLCVMPARAQDVPTPDHRRLDWLSPADIAALPPEQRPVQTGICAGAYLPPTPGTPNPADTRINAAADRFDTAPDGTLELEGQVEVRQGDSALKSDRVRLNRLSRETELNGNVEIRQNGMLIRGDSARMNLDQKKLDVRGTEYVIHELHAHGRADRIHNPGKNVLVLDHSTYSTCEPDDNTWQLRAGRIKLDRDSGWGQVRDAVVEVKDVPIVYLPWWLYPIDDRRQTGFLFPEVGNNSESGIRFGVPLYLNLAPHYDATLTPTLIGERGTLLEGEFRYLSPHTEGFVGGALLPSDNDYNEQDRSLGVWKHTGHYGRLVNSVDYTEVSDIDYFEDLYTNLETSATTHLDQRANLVYHGDQWQTGVLVQQFQTIDQTIAQQDLPYRKLPQVHVSGQVPTVHEPLQLLLGSEYVYFEHPDTGSPTLTVADYADRARASLGLQYDLRRPWGFLVPAHTQRYRYYNITGGPLDQQEPDVQIPVSSIDSGLFFDRPLQLGSHRFVQTLEPRLYYLYVPYREQNDLPLFDTAKNSFGFEQLFRDNRFTGGDRIGDANQVSLGFTSRFIDNDSGLERLNLGLGQTFYLKDREVQLYDTDPVEETDVSPYVARAYWMMNSAWSWRTEVQVDTAVNNLDTLVTGLAYRGPEGNLLNLNYNYYDDGAITADPATGLIRQTDISFIWSLTRRWGIIGRWGYDLEQDRSFDNIVGVEYESCCWRARLVNRRYLKESNTEPDVLEPSQGIYLQIELKGLGGIGGTVDSILEEGVAGYPERQALRPDTF